jgi:carbohydrate diacid regulator
MPIIVDHQVIGVVGVSGHPDQVRAIAKMVKMIAELILEQEILQEEAHSQSQLRENFIALLLSDNTNANHDKIVKTAKLLKYDLTLPRLVLVIDIQPLLELAFEQFGLNELVVYRTKENLLNLLLPSPEIKPTDFVVFLENRLIILKHFSKDTLTDTYTIWALAILKCMKLNNNIHLQLGLGSLAANYTTLEQSYQEALFALTKSDISTPASSIQDFSILTAYLLENIKTNDPQPVNMMKKRLDGDLTRKYDMKATLLCLLDNNLNLTATAKDLYIHRNTLLFRLKKLKESTGLDPCRFFNHAILCKIISKEL